MKQESMVKFTSENGKIEVFCESTTPLGDIHDFLMFLKGDIVERMVKAQRDEEEFTKAQREKSEEKEE